jgi:protein-S-isoprenylcysteine O-methyltransferase Ste14
MYAIMLLLLWLGPTMTYSRLEFSILASVYFIIGTFHEEKNLRRELGEIYDVYRENVPMWIPRLRPWKMPNINMDKT